MRLTYATALVLLALDRGYRHGFDIIDATGLKAGTVYPILRRLDAERLAHSTWEAVQRARAEGRPPRRNYVLTAAGGRVLEDALARYPGLGRVLEERGRDAAASTA
ncbi:MAG: PadR family transcriptional regulator [Longimicrobiales bacterium]